MGTLEGSASAPSSGHDPSSPAEAAVGVNNHRRRPELIAVALGPAIRRTKQAKEVVLYLVAVCCVHVIML